MNLGDLPSRRGSKKPKPSKNPPPKVPKFTSQTVDQDEPVINVVPVQTIPPVQTDPPLPTKTSRRTHPSEPSKEPPNLVLDEGYAWRTFKGIITDNEVNSCYNMSVKDFERSAIHDLFKVHMLYFFFFLSVGAVCGKALNLHFCSLPFFDKDCMVRTRSMATSTGHEESGNASSHPNRHRQSAPVMPTPSMQHIQSMATAMAELTRQNQELTREIGRRQHQGGHTEGQAQSQEVGGENVELENQSGGTTS